MLLINDANTVSQFLNHIIFFLILEYVFSVIRNTILQYLNIKESYTGLTNCKNKCDDRQTSTVRKHLRLICLSLPFSLVHSESCLEGAVTLKNKHFLYMAKNVVDDEMR